MKLLSMDVNTILEAPGLEKRAPTFFVQLVTAVLSLWSTLANSNGRGSKVLSKE